MKILREKIDCKSLEIYEVNFYDGVSFSKVTSQQCSDRNFTINKTHQRLLLEYVPKLAVLKRIKREVIFFWGKKCSPVAQSPQIYQKRAAHVRPSCRSAGISNLFTGTWWRLFFTKVAGLEFIPAISLKRTPPQRNTSKRVKNTEPILNFI